MSFWSSLFGGQNKTLNADIGNIGGIANFSTGQGESDINAGTSLLKGIVSGDAGKISQVLAPQISAAKKSAQENMKSTAEFGTRSGGTAASNAATSDKVHAEITNLIGNLTGNAASSLLSTGSGLLGTGLQGYSDQINASQIQLQNWSDSILGLGVTKGAGYLESAALASI
jgi:hypothetical protein